jgi:transposase-like protein
VIGATADDGKELVAVEGGYRESAQSWKEVLLNLQHRGLSQEPELVVGDGALGFWKAVSEVFPNCRWQRRWVHKTTNVLNCLSKKIQSKAKTKLHEIWMSETKQDAEAAFDLFVKTYESKYSKATACLIKDRDSLLTFYGFPAERWKHIRITNPIESTFATVRLRTAKVRNCFSSATVVNTAFKLCQCAAKKWGKLCGSERLAELIEGVRFIDGIFEKEIAA